MAAPTASRMIAGLVKAGVVARTSCSDDRRAVTISLTPRGEELIAAKRSRVQGKRREFLDSLEPGEREQACSLLLRMAEVMDQL